MPLPRAPPKPVIVNATRDSMTVSWSDPEERFDSNAIIGYHLEYFSSDSQPRQWVRVKETILSTVYTVSIIKTHVYNNACGDLFLRLFAYAGNGLESGLQLCLRRPSGESGWAVTPQSCVRCGLHVGKSQRNPESVREWACPRAARFCSDRPQGHSAPVTHVS